MKKFHLSLSLLSLVALMLGCVALGAKKAAEAQIKSREKKQVDVPITVDNQPADLCPRLLSGSRSAATKNFLYVLDTTNKNCIATKWQDLFGEGKLFPLGQYDSLVFESKEKEGGPYSMATWDANYYYKQYYKGIAVNGSRVMLNVAKGKIVRLVGTFYPNIDVDLKATYPIKPALDQLLDILLKSPDVNVRYPGYIDKERMIREHTTELLGAMDGVQLFYVFTADHRDGIKGEYRMLCNAHDGTKPHIIELSTNLREQFTDTLQCRACNGSISSIIPNCASNLNTNCTANSCTLFSNDVATLSVPTLYNNCQEIVVDECTDSGINKYRLSALSANTDPVRVYNGYTNANVIGTDNANNYREITWCEHGDTLAEKDAIATTAYWATTVAHNYAKLKMNYDTSIKVIVHFPNDGPPGSGLIYPECGAAEWQQNKHRMVLGDGDDDYSPLVSLDIVAHEYGHYLLYNQYKINFDANPALYPSVYDTKAIHEGVSDIFSVLIRRYEGNYDWKVGHTALINPDYAYAPRNVAYPDSSRPAQATYYNDINSGWTTNYSRYNQAGIISKWFYLLSNGGTGAHFAADNITVQPLTIDTAELVLIKGLNQLKIAQDTVPTYEQFCKAMVDAAQTISCNARLQTLRASKAVGLGLSIPGGKTDQTQDDALCFVDLQMSDCWSDQGDEPNHQCDLPGWQDIWTSPDLWNCTTEECDLNDADNPEAALQNHIGFRIYNAHPSLLSDPATLHLYYTMGSTGEYWDTNPLYNSWTDNYYSTGNETCYLGDELPNSPLTIPAIDPQTHYTGYTTWSPPNFVAPTSPFYTNPDNCGLALEQDPADGDYKYEICLLARLESAADPINNEQNGSTTYNILNSNNIVTRNMFLIDPAQGGMPPYIQGGHPSVILMTNNNDEIRNLDLLFDKISAGSTEALNEVLKIEFVLGQPMWDKWASTGFKGEGIQITAERTVKITNLQTAKLLDIPFDPREFQPFAIRVTILSYSGKTNNNLPNDFTFKISHQAYNNAQSIQPPTNCLFTVKDINQKSQSISSTTQLSCYPNPFDEKVQLNFYLPTPQKASLAIYNVQGKLVQLFIDNTLLSAGLHTYQLTANSLPSGVYICQLVANKQTIVQKIVCR